MAWGHFTEYVATRCATRGHFLAQLDGVLAQYAQIKGYLASDNHHDPGKDQDVTCNR